MIGAVAALAGISGRPAVAAEQPLSATATPNQGKVGTVTQVVGAGWPANSAIQLSTCGGLAIEGSVSCDRLTRANTSSDRRGRFVAQLTLGAPPRPCPCVVHVISPASPRTVNIPVVIEGHRVGAVPGGPPPAGRTSIVSTEAVNTSSWTATFGAAATNDLVLVLRNDTATPASPPPLQLTLESLGGVPVPVASPVLGPVPAQSERTYRVPFELPAGVGGTYLLRGSMAGQPDFTVQTSSWAWGFFALDTVLLALLIVVVFVRVSRSTSKRTESVADGRHHRTQQAAQEPLESLDDSHTGSSATAHLSDSSAP
jgi:hypothetical protein